MKERSDFRGGSILSQMKNFFRKNNMFHEFPSKKDGNLKNCKALPWKEYPKCGKCRGNPVTNEWSKYTDGRTYFKFLEDIVKFKKA